MAPLILAPMLTLFPTPSLALTQTPDTLTLAPSPPENAEREGGSEEMLTRRDGQAG